MLGKVFVGILALFLLLGAFASPINDGIKTWRTQNITESFAVTTGGGETTENVTLASDLFQATTSEVESITSTLGGETPVASSYTEATNVLLVAGLTESQSRTLTINYYAEPEETIMRAIGPFLAFLIFGGIIGAIMYGIFHKSGRR